jgi:hypothetical protein
MRRAVAPEDVKRIVVEMSRSDDNSRDPKRENVAGLEATKTVEPPPSQVVVSRDPELN